MVNTMKKNMTVEEAFAEKIYEEFSDLVVILKDATGKPYKSFWAKCPYCGEPLDGSDPWAECPGCGAT